MTCIYCGQPLIRTAGSWALCPTHDAKLLGTAGADLSRMWLLSFRPGEKGRPSRPGGK